MALAYAAGTGMVVSSFCVSETLGSQTQQTGNNQIVFSNVPYSTSGYGGNAGDGTNGAGDSYINRRVVVDIAGTPQERIITAQSAGTTTTQICTVHEDWDTNPASSDIADVYYEYADMEDGSEGGGINLSTKSGLYELSRLITIGDGTNKSGLASHGGAALETPDVGTGNALYIRNNGYLRSGYYAGGLPINGGIFTYTSKSNDELGMTADSGADVQFLDSLVWAQVAVLSTISNAGASITYDKTKILKATLECELYADTISDLSVVGTGLSTEIARVDASTTCTSMTLVNIQVIDTAADISVETITLSGVVFSGVAGYVDVRQNKTWNLIDPLWDVTTYTDLTWTGTSTGNELNDKRSVKPTVQKADGTKLQNALINVYENTILADLVLEAVTDVNGLVDDSFIYKKHATNSATTTYGGHALQCGKWLYKPFVAAQTATDNFLGAIVLSPDSNIVQTTQATAESAGSTVTWNEDTNASSVLSFTGGSGTLAVGETVTGGTSTADGIVTEILDGDSTAGEIHLKTRDANAFSGTETLSNGAGWTATLTASSEQRFSVWIDCQTLSLQTIYDYLASIQNKTTLTADGELIWEWCRSAQTQPLYATGSSFYTERSNSLGIFLVDIGGGTLDYATDDAGVTWSPPASVTVTFEAVDGLDAAIAEVRVSAYRISDDVEVINTLTSAGGIATTNYADTTPVDIYYKYKKGSGTDNRVSLSGFATIKSVSGASVKRSMRPDTNNNT